MHDVWSETHAAPEVHHPNPRSWTRHRNDAAPSASRLRADDPAEGPRRPQSWRSGDCSCQTTLTMMESAVGTDWGPFFRIATWLLLCMSTLSRYQPAGTAGHEPAAIPL